MHASRYCIAASCCRVTKYSPTVPRFLFSYVYSTNRILNWFQGERGEGRALRAGGFPRALPHTNMYCRRELIHGLQIADHRRSTPCGGASHWGERRESRDSNVRFAVLSNFRPVHSDSRDPFACAHDSQSRPTSYWPQCRGGGVSCFDDAAISVSTVRAGAHCANGQRCREARDRRYDYRSMPMRLRSDRGGGVERFNNDHRRRLTSFTIERILRKCR